MYFKGRLSWFLVIILGLALVTLACAPKTTTKPPPTPSPSLSPTPPPAKAPPPAATPTPTAPPTSPTPAPATGDPTAGKAVFQSQGCPACHMAQGSGGQVGPSLDGLYGSKVKLTTGQEVTADDTYIQESIVKPKAKVAAGYQPIMPETYAQLPAKDMDNLAAFIRSLAK